MITVHTELLPSDETAVYIERFAFYETLFTVKETTENMELG